MVKLYLDADVNPLAAQRLRERGHDVLSVWDLGLERLPDPEQLAHAARDGRALVTCNIQHFAPLYEQWWHEERRHPGIIVSRQYNRDELGELLRLLENVLGLATDEDLVNRLRYLSEFDA